MESRFSPFVRDITNYDTIKQVGEGTYGFACCSFFAFYVFPFFLLAWGIDSKVWKARCKDTHEYVALKQMNFFPNKVLQGVCAYFFFLLFFLMFSLSLLVPQSGYTRDSSSEKLVSPECSALA